MTDAAPITDKDRVDWLDQNLFNREMDAWDKNQLPHSAMWVLFAPGGVQGDARRIIDACIERDRNPGRAR